MGNTCLISVLFATLALATTPNPLGFFAKIQGKFVPLRFHHSEINETSNFYSSKYPKPSEVTYRKGFARTSAGNVGLYGRLLAHGADLEAIQLDLNDENKVINMRGMYG